MFIYKLSLCTVVFLIVSCSSFPDISRTNSTDLGPWLTISGDPTTSVDVTWLTREKEKTGLFYGTDRGNLEEYREDSPVKKLHTVALQNLKPGIQYYYSIDEEIFTFQKAGSGGEDYKITVIGDLQPFKKESRISNRLMAEALIRESSDLIAQVGDVSESGGMNFLQAWTLKNIDDYASQIPFIAAVGNHDYYTKGKENFRRLFPYNYPSKTELYHSLHYKNASLFFLDVHIENREVSPGQKLWFETSLKEASERGDRWIFVFVHDVILTSGSASMNWNLQKWLAPLADSYGVDALFFGHSHNYEHWEYQYGKTGLLYKGDDTPSGDPIHYFCTGGGGAYMRIESLLERADRNVLSRWVEASEKEPFTVSAVVKSWDQNKYIDHRDNPLNGASPRGKSYYQLPRVESYSGYNGIYGYQYGEKSLHYINLEFSGEENDICTISVHYPDGSLLSGPEGTDPQKWVLER